MPVYEFQCLSCGKKFSTLVGMTADSGVDPCPKCGSQQLSKLVSRVAKYRTEDDRIEELADQMDTMGEPDSPSEMRKMVREMGKAMDEDSSDEMEEIFESDMAGDLDDE